MAWGESGEFDKVANANANGRAKERGQYLNQFSRFFMASPMLLKRNDAALQGTREDGVKAGEVQMAVDAGGRATRTFHRWGRLEDYNPEL